MIPQDMITVPAMKDPVTGSLRKMTPSTAEERGCRG